MADLLLTFWMVYGVIFMIGWFIAAVLGFCELIAGTIEDDVIAFKIFQYTLLWPIMPLVWIIKACVRHAKVLKSK